MNETRRLLEEALKQLRRLEANHPVRPYPEWAKLMNEIKTHLEDTKDDAINEECPGHDTGAHYCAGCGAVF